MKKGKKDGKLPLSAVELLISGATAGVPQVNLSVLSLSRVMQAIGKTSTAPIDRVKILYQVYNDVVQSTSSLCHESYRWIPLANSRYAVGSRRPIRS